MVVVSRVRGWRAALVAGVLIVLATACLTDVTAEYGDAAMVMVINDRGVMAGYTGPNRDPARFDANRVTVPLRGYEGTRAYVDDINNANEVLATVEFDVDGVKGNYPVVWRDNGDLIDLRTMVPHAGRPEVNLYADAITNEGLVVGHQNGYDRAAATEVAGWFAVNIHTGKRYDIPLETTGRYTYPNAVNDAGVIVGRTDAGPARWTPQGDTYVREPLTDRNFWPEDINNHGDMVGLYIPSDEGAVWMHDAPAPKPLPTAGLGPNYFALNAWITDGGVAVVYFQGSNGPIGELTVRYKPDASLPEGTKPERFPTDTWRLFYALDVNENGTVVGSAENYDFVRHWLRWSLDT